MEESIEKSCWGVTLWAIAIVLVVVVAGSFIMGGDPTPVTGVATAVSG